MRKIVVLLVVAALVAAGTWLYRASNGSTAAAGPTSGPGGMRGAGGRPPMTVDTAPVTRQEVIDYITVVGNLVGAATVDVVPRVAGRLESVSVRLGDRVTRGQSIAKMEDRELREQVNQAQATLDVNKANVVQRQNDLQVQKNALDRIQASFDSGLASRQNLEDAQARHNLAASQVEVARAQQAQTQSRIDELHITLSNTTILAPIDGFVSRRNLDPGAFAGTNTMIVTVVDLGTVRLVANLVEKGFKRVTSGVEAKVQVDAFPGEDFRGQVSRVAPVFDPATRTAPMEIEVPNPGYRLKPGMYARVRLTLERRPEALTVPRNAVVDLDGQRGVFVIDDLQARFVPVEVGISDGERTEILSGLTERDRVITTGALALRNGDRVALPDGGRGRGGAPAGRSGAKTGGAPATGRGR